MLVQITFPKVNNFPLVPVTHKKRILFDEKTLYVTLTSIEILSMVKGEIAYISTSQCLLISAN